MLSSVYIPSKADALTDLFAAVKGGQLLKVERLIKNSISQQAFKNLSSTLLHQAVNNRHSKVLKYLVDYGAFIDCMDANQTTPLHVAARNGDIDSLSVLIKYGADINASDYDNRNPLYFAAHDGHNDCLIAILEHEKVDISITRNGGWSALHETARFGHVESTKALIRCGMDIMARTSDAKWTPGHMAASCGRLECLKYLIEAGIDVNAGAGGVTYSSTLLHEACRNGHDDCIELLLHSGADPSLYDGPDLPHHLACKYGHASALNIILSYFHHVNRSYLVDAFTNVDPQAEPYLYYNAVHMASFYGKKECLNILLKHHAQNLPNGIGRFPEDLAVAKLQIDCLKVLISDLRNKKEVVTLRRNTDITNKLNPLYYLCKNSFKTNDKIIACACLLLNSGLVDIDMEFDSHRSCLEIAAQLGAVDLVRYLLRSGADPFCCEDMEYRCRNNPHIQTCVELVDEAKTEPKSLLLCSRLKIRECLMNKGMEGVFELPLHKGLKHYVYHGHYRVSGLCDL